MRRPNPISRPLGLRRTLPPGNRGLAQAGYLAAVVAALGALETWRPNDELAVRQSVVAAAPKAEEAEKRRLRDGKPNDGMTLAAAALRYCDEVAAHQASADDTEKALEHCARLIGSARLVRTITADDIADAVRRRSAESYGKRKPRLVSPATVNRQIVELKKAG